MLAPGQKQQHFNFFFNSANQAQLPGEEGSKKDGQAGIYFLREMTDAARGPKGDGVSMLNTRYPAAKHLILSGDTGNGYRAYEMLEELSGLSNRSGFTVELIPLARVQPHRRPHRAHERFFEGAEAKRQSVRG